MTSSFYLDAAATAENLLREFGQVAELRRVIEGIYDPDTGTSTPQEVKQPIVAAGFQVDEKMVNGSSILSGDQTFYISAVGIQAPEVGDVLMWPVRGSDAKGFRLVGVKPLAPARVPVLYEAQARR